MEALASPGLQLVLIGIAHTVVGFALFGPKVRQMMADGWIGTIGRSADRASIFWFLWFGWMLMLLGGAIRALEPGLVPLPVVVGCAAMILGGAAAIPRSGFWLGLIPLVGMVLPRL